MKKDKVNWNNITYKQFQQLKEALEIEDETDKMIAIASAVYGDDVLDKPVQEFRELYSKLGFLSEEIPTSIKVKNVVVNDREYYFDGMLGVVTTAQYIDYQNYAKNKDELKSFSVFFIPKDHKYNDGYDMLQVFKDLEDFPMPVLMSASFFFKRQLEIFIRIFQRSSKQRIKNLNIPKKIKKLLNQILTSSANLASYRMSSNSVK